jgi:hypothetical protein
LSYLGNNALPFNPLATSGKPRDAQRFNGDNTTTTFVLNFRVDNPTDLEVFVENVQQEPLTAYDAYNNQLVFTEAPPSGTNNIYVVYRNTDPGIYAQIPDGSITFNKLANNIRLFTTDNFTGDGGTTTFNLSSDVADANTLVVAVDGVFQRAPIHYTTSNNTITFASAPPSSSNVHVRHLGFRTTQTVTALPAQTPINQPILENPSVNLNLSFAGTGNRIRGDFSNATVANRVMFQTSTVDSQTSVIAIPNGTGTTTQFIGVNNSNTSNASIVQLAALSSEVSVRSGALGTGSFLPMTFHTNGFERMRIATDGQQSSTIVGQSGVFPEYKCRAWVNFNGSGTPAIRASGNVSSITRMGTGQFQVNFANAMPDVNYAVSCASGGTSAGNRESCAVIAASYATTHVGVNPYTGSVSNFDSTHVFVSIFR